VSALVANKAYYYYNSCYNAVLRRVRWDLYGSRRSGATFLRSSASISADSGSRVHPAHCDHLQRSHHMSPWGRVPATVARDVQNVRPECLVLSLHPRPGQV